MEYLDIEIVYKIHEIEINNYGGTSEHFKDTKGKIESIINNQYPQFGYSKYNNVYEIAAMLWYFFTKGHCFMDGNKRVGFATMVVFLGLNNLKFTMDKKTATNISLKIAKSNSRNEEIDKDIKELSSIIKAFTIKFNY